MSRHSRNARKRLETDKMLILWHFWGGTSGTIFFGDSPMGLFSPPKNYTCAFMRACSNWIFVQPFILGHIHHHHLYSAGPKNTSLLLCYRNKRIQMFTRSSCVYCRTAFPMLLPPASRFAPDPDIDHQSAMLCALFLKVV